MSPADETSGADQPGGRTPGADRRPKRANREGTFYFDGRLKRWRGEILLDGRRRKVTGKTQREVQRKVAELRQDHLMGTLPAPHRLTVGAYLTDWLETVVRARRRASTYNQYESPIRVHVLPRLGGRRLQDLQPRDLERLYADLEAGVGPRADRRPGRPTAGRGLAPKSIRNLHTGLHAAFERAVRHRLLRRNPAEGVELPALRRRRALAVTPEDVQRPLAHTRAEGDRAYPLWCFLANTGLRIGEALALRWANVDLEGGWFTVEEDLARALRAPKRAAAERLQAILYPAAPAAPAASPPAGDGRPGTAPALPAPGELPQQLPQERHRPLP